MNLLSGASTLSFHILELQNYFIVKDCVGLHGLERPLQAAVGIVCFTGKHELLFLGNKHANNWLNKFVTRAQLLRTALDHHSVEETFGFYLLRNKNPQKYSSLLFSSRRRNDPIEQDYLKKTLQVI